MPVHGTYFVPSFVNGRADGFKMGLLVRPATVFSAAGLRQDDVIHEVRGQPIRNPDTALAAYAALNAEWGRGESLELSLGLRRGACYRMHYLRVR